MTDKTSVQQTLKLLAKTPGLWQERLQNAAAVRRDLEEQWARNERTYLYGDPNEEHDSQLDGIDIKVNRVKGLVETSHAATTLNNPRGKVYPRMGGDSHAAAWAEKWVNQQWQQQEALKEFRRTAIDVEIIGHGWCKVGWRHIETEIEIETQPETTELETLDPYDNAETLTDTQKRTVTVVSEPYVDRVSPFDVWVDPTAANIDDVRYIVQRVFRTVNDIRNDESYDPKTRRKVTGAIAGVIGEETAMFSRYSGLNQHESDEIASEYDRLVAVYEYWSLEDDYHWGVWCGGADGWLIKPEPWPLEEHPFILIRDGGTSSTFYPVGQVHPVISLQQELNFIRNKQLEFVDNYAPKLMMDDSSLNEVTVGDISESEPLTVVRVKLPPNRTLNELVLPLPQPPMPQDWLAMSEIIARDIDQVGAIPDYAHPTNRARSATEAALQQDQTSVRAQEKNNLYERAAATIMRRWVGLAQKYLDLAIPIKLSDDDQNVKPKFVRMIRQNIQSQMEFEFKIEVSSMAPRDDVVNRMEAVQLIQTLFPLMQAGIVNPKPAIEKLLTSFGVTNVDDYMTEEQGWRFPPPVFASPTTQRTPAPQPQGTPGGGPQLGQQGTQQGQPGAGFGTGDKNQTGLPQRGIMR